MTRSGWSKTILVVICALFAGCGPVAPLGADNRVTYREAALGSEGGVLSVDGARLTVPRGALLSDTLVYLRRTSEAPEVPIHVTALGAGFEIGPERAVLAGRPRLELTYEEGQADVVIVEHTDCAQPAVRDSAADGTTVGGGVATFELDRFGRFALGVAESSSCTSMLDCPCDDDCPPPGEISYCDGTTGQCATGACDDRCTCLGMF